MEGKSRHSSPNWLGIQGVSYNQEVGWDLEWLDSISLSWDRIRCKPSNTGLKLYFKVSRYIDAISLVTFQFHSNLHIRKSCYQCTEVSLTVTYLSPVHLFCPSGNQRQSVFIVNSTSSSKTELLPFSCLFEILNDSHLYIVRKLLLLQVKDSSMWLTIDTFRRLLSIFPYHQFFFPTAS